MFFFCYTSFVPRKLPIYPAAVGLLCLFSLVEDYWFLLLGQKLRIDFLSLSVSFVDVDGFFCFWLLLWRLCEVTSHEELVKLKQMYASLGTETEHLSSVDFTRRNELDLSTLPGPRCSRLPPSREPYWLVPLLIFSGTTMILGAICYALRNHLGRILMICRSKSTTESKVASTSSHASPHAQQTPEYCPEKSTLDVHFTTYTTPQK
jgi:hypothetical protein